MASPAPSLSITPPPQPLSARVVDSVSGFGEEALDAVAAGSSIFCDRRWFRLMESFGASRALNGEVTFRYVVVTAGSELVALAPFLITRSQTIFTPYSLERVFFTAWKDSVAKMNKGEAGWLPWLVRVAEGYRRLARLARTGSEGWVLATSPAGGRGEIACKAMPEEERLRVERLVVEALKDVARAEGLPLCFFWQREEEALLGRLRAGGFEPVFVSAESVFETGGKTLEEFYAGLSRNARKRFRLESKVPAQEGIRFEARRDFSPYAEKMSEFYNATYGKYSDEFFMSPPEFFQQMEQHLGRHAEALLAFKGDALVGFTLYVYKGDSLTPLRIGRAGVAEKQEPPIYFNLAFYELIRRAAELGVKRIWHGQLAWEVKRMRGARGMPLYNAFWFPTRRSRAVLRPYMSLYGRMARAQVMRFVEVSPNSGGEGALGKPTAAEGRQP